MQQSFIRDADIAQRLRNILAMYYPLLLFNLALPFLLYYFGPLWGRQYSMATTGAIALFWSVGLMLWAVILGNLKTRWGDNVNFGKQLTITRKDGTTLIIDRATIERTQISPGKTIAVIWQDRGKIRLLMLGREGFMPATWQQLVRCAQAWTTQT